MMSGEARKEVQVRATEEEAVKSKWEFCHMVLVEERKVLQSFFILYRMN
jgi:hypothetical protein